MMSNGQIGPFLVKAPIVLGHEAAGTIVEVGSEVTNLKVGDRVCMEPGIPDPNSWETRLGIYNLDPAVRFWATPRVHRFLALTWPTRRLTASGYTSALPKAGGR